jgi:hypothetical protein
MDMNRFHGAPMVLPATGNKYVHARGGSPSRLRAPHAAAAYLSRRRAGLLRLAQTLPRRPHLPPSASARAYSAPPPLSP